MGMRESLQPGTWIQGCIDVVRRWLRIAPVQNLTRSSLAVISSVNLPAFNIKDNRQSWQVREHRS